MKRIMSLIAVALLLVVLLTACSKPANDESSESSKVSVSQAESSDFAERSELTYADVEWVVEPMLEYEWIYYCGGCGFSTEMGIIDEKTGLVLNEHPGHGGWSEDFYYDKEKVIVGYTTIQPGDETYDTYTIEKFAAQFPRYADKLILFAEYDSTKVKTEENEVLPVEYNFDEAVTGKYAMALGEKLITAFEFEGGERTARRKLNNIIAVKKDGKWGIIDKDGNTVAPFVFEDAISIDDTTAFAKYDGKWGIIKVK